MNTKDKIKSALDDCWNCHKDILKEFTKRKDLEEYLESMDITDWDMVCWFSGYLAGLKETA